MTRSFLNDSFETADVLTQVASMEYTLEWILRERMPNLGEKDLANNLFGRGPLGTLAAKIDVCFAMGFIDRPTWKNLHQLRKIRNEFAHSPEMLGFDHPRIKTLKENSLSKDRNAYFIGLKRCHAALRLAIHATIEAVHGPRNTTE